MEEEEMDETMDEGDGRFTSEEFDLDYEFSAPRFYDFTRLETPQESQEAEAWFNIAAGYPPSPYLVNLHMTEDLLEVHVVENDDTTHRLTGLVSYLPVLNEDKREHSQEISIREQCAEVQVDYMQNSSKNFKSTNLEYLIDDFNGLVCNSSNMQDLPRSLKKSLSCVSLPRNSTLMRPTASHLAKQRMPISKFPKDRKGSSKITRRVETVLLVKHDTIADKTSCNECQASKRQKLDGDQLRKIQQIHDMKQPVPLLHKEPKGVPVRGNNSNCSEACHTLTSSKCALSMKDRCAECIHEQIKFRLTVPREPALETSQKARRIRAKIVTDPDEHVVAKAPLFKAQPLNRKIFETPSLALPQRSDLRVPIFQEFCLKTSERALQHSMSASSMLSCIYSDNASNISSTATRSVPSNTKPSRHLSTKSLYPKSKDLDAAKPDDHEHNNIFKARPLNKKIFSSKGDIGIYRNSKRENTKPMGFNFSTDKRFHQPNPLTELFKKLSLKSEVQPNYASQVLYMGEEKQQAFQTDANRAAINGGETEMSKQGPLGGDHRFPFKERMWHEHGRHRRPEEYNKISV